MQGLTHRQKYPSFPHRFGFSGGSSLCSLRSFAAISLSLLLVSPGLAQIKIGAVSCISGGLSTFGVSSIRGARMAIDEINAAGGVLGQPIELIIDDNGSKAGETARIARKFLSEDHVAAILGDLTSSATLEAAPLAQAAHVPLLTPTATNVAITKNRRLRF
jgi:ABC-type branched-subunit amino acid transport system substrate-binding protein